MTRHATPKLAAYALLTALGLLASLVFARPEPAVLAAPFGVTLALGLALARRPDVRAALELERERALEGDEIVLVLDLYARYGAPRLELLLDLPGELELVAGANRTALRLEGGEERRLELRLRCSRWGAHRIGDLHLRLRDAAGLLVWEQTLERRALLQVYPRPEALRELVRPLETQVFAGNRVARQKGEGLEFADLRPFAPGDRLRRINWRASARRGEVWVNELYAERNADVILFLDSFAEARGNEGGGTLDQAIRAAASLTERYLVQKDRVGLVNFGGVLNWLQPGTGLLQLYRIVEALLNTEVTLSYAWKEIDVLPRRTLPPKALVIALTPLLDDRAVTALLDLRARGFDLVIVEISPLPFVEAPPGGSGELAYRLWKLRREARRLEYERAGAPVVEWLEDAPLTAVLEGVSAFRRHARARV
jgi:uncharacterized protein (DUF58 family)